MMKLESRVESRESRGKGLSFELGAMSLGRERSSKKQSSKLKALSSIISVLVFSFILHTSYLILPPQAAHAQGTCAQGMILGPGAVCIPDPGVTPMFDTIDPGLDPDNPLAPACKETPEAAFCQDIGPEVGSNDDDPVQDFISLGVNIIVIITMIAASFALVYSAILYIYSGGNDESIKKAKKTLTFAIVGVIVVLFVDQILAVAFSI